MKKRIAAALLTPVLCLGLAVPVMAAGTNTSGRADTAYATTYPILVNGSVVNFDAYALRNENGDDTNYLKLRDVAYVLNGTSAQFSIDWDAASGAIFLTTGAPYSNVGSEMSTPFSGDQPCTSNSAAVLVDRQLAGLSSIVLTDENGGDYTYFKLRDLGQHLGFFVDYDDANSVIVINTEPEEESEYVMPNGKPLTDENIQEVIYGLKSDYPEGMRWTNEQSHYSPALYMTGYGCAGFALICSDAVFGSLPASGTYTDFDSIRVGDMLRINHNTHSVVVLEKRENSVIVAEGNYNSSIHWGREISRSALEGDMVGTTRYPK